MKYAWINQHRDSFPVAVMCDVLNVSPSGYYDSIDREPSNRDRCNERILCGVISWRRGFQEFTETNTGCNNGEITRCGEGEVLAGDNSATGSQWTRNEAVLCPGRDFRTSVLLVAANLASARSAANPSTARRWGGGLGP